MTIYFFVYKPKKYGIGFIVASLIRDGTEIEWNRIFA